MHLLIFDIDGTLCDTNYVDELCLVNAAHKVLQVQNISSDWSTYKHSTDSGIILELIDKVKGYSDPEAYSLIKHTCMKLFEEYYKTEPVYFNPILGADTIIPTLINKGFAVGIATGCWLDSALFKLEKAGINSCNVPMSSADFIIERVNIINHCINACREFYNQQDFLSITYIGDGVWDFYASKELEINFIGIAKGDRAKKLSDIGVEYIIEEFSYIYEFL